MTVARYSFKTIAALSLLVALVSWRFLGLGLELSFPEFYDHIESRRTLFLMHVIAAPLALALGVFQFVPNLRARRPGLHRWMGRVYALSILVGGLASLALAFNAPGGAVAGFGFGILALLWLISTGKAVIHAMRRELEAHRAWMIRSFALTFAGVTLRLYLAGFMLMGVGYVEASVWLAWLCWIPNLVVAEVVLGPRVVRPD